MGEFTWAESQNMQRAPVQERTLYEKTQAGWVLGKTYPLGKYTWANRQKIINANELMWERHDSDHAEFIRNAKVAYQF